jgi:hypothetical protein
MASKLANDVVRRVAVDADYAIVELSLIAGDVEKLKISARNPRQDPREIELTLSEALTQLAPWLKGEEEEPKISADGKRVLSGMIDAFELETRLMTDADLASFSFRCRLWRMVRAIQNDEPFTDYPPQDVEAHVFPALGKSDFEVDLELFKVLVSPSPQGYIVIRLDRALGELHDRKVQEGVRELKAFVADIYLDKKKGPEYLRGEKGAQDVKQKALELKLL